MSNNEGDHHPQSLSSTEDQFESASAMQNLGIALADRFACPPHTSDLKPGSFSVHTDLHPFTHHPNHQPHSEQVSDKAFSRKRKYQVTTMAESPLKLRISCSGPGSLSMDGPSDKPSPWDALAGEDLCDDDTESAPDRSGVPSGQQAGSGTPDHDFTMLEEGDEIYQAGYLPSFHDHY